MSEVVPINRKTSTLLSSWKEYRAKRLHFLETIGIPDSNKDPMSEFSEVLVANLVGGELAENRTQKGYDLIADNKRIQVKYLSNPENKWINWHTVKFNEDMDLYALVYIEQLEPKYVFIFQKRDLTRLCDLLGKRHKNIDKELQFTKTNYEELIRNPEKYRDEGVEVIKL